MVVIVSQFQIGSIYDEFRQLRFSLITDISLDGGVKMRQDGGDVKVDKSFEGPVLVPDPLHAEVEHELSDLVRHDDAGHGLHHEGGGAAEAGAGPAMLPDLVEKLLILGVSRNVGLHFLVSLPRPGRGIPPGEQELQHLLPHHVTRRGRELGLEVVLEAGEDGSGYSAEQGRVRHGQLDVGVGRGLQEAEVVLKAESPETRDWS